MNGLGKSRKRPSRSLPKPSKPFPWPGGFAIAA